MILFFHQRRQQRQPLDASAAAGGKPLAPTQTAANPAPANQQSPTDGSGQNLPAVDGTREKQIWATAIATPITFYGKVVDENGNAVEHAKVQISIHDHLYGGNSKIEKTTDPKGCFEVSGQGLGLGVMVSKVGYYTFEKSRGSFGYARGAGTGRPHADRNDPAIFILRQMGATEPLIEIANRDISIPTDGRVIKLSLKTGRSVPSGSGDIQVQTSAGATVGSSPPYDWTCRISVPNGGLKARTEPFDFQAPAEGYQSFDQINMPATLGQKWRSQVERNYFVINGDGNYARLNLTITVGRQRFVTVASYLNPSGSRNLEFDPKKQIKPR